jgi:hypothetical protein
MTYSAVIKSFSALLVTSSLVFISSCKDDEDPVVTKDEGVYINEVYSNGPDWIELYNSTDETKVITNYAIYDDATNKYKLPVASIPPKGFLVLVCDDTGVGLSTNFKLTSGGETVYLENSSGELIDKVEFPEMGEGQSYGRYPDGSTTLLVSGNTTEGSSNDGSAAPAIVDVTRVPRVPASTDDVTVQAEFISTSDITSVKLFYRLSTGPFTQAAMTKAGNFYNGTIPAFNAVGKVEYYVEATNSGGKTSVHPAEAPDKVHDFLLNADPLPPLRVNEFLAFNSSCCPDTDGGVNEYDDWIEIYNDSNSPVNIGGMYLSDDKTNPFNSKIPDDNPSATTIPAKGFIVLWADGSKSQGPLHLDFSLSNAGEDVALFYIDGRLIDAHTFTGQTENKSEARKSPTEWLSNQVPSQGLANP